jgi:hypothetical protein
MQDDDHSLLRADWMKGDGLVQVGNEEVSAADGCQGGHHLQGAEAIGIGLNHRGA